jgi:Ser/Thr protein kinase RdoA (MazF antagonist)
MKALLKQWNIADVESMVPTPLGGGKTWFVTTEDKGDFVLKGSDRRRAEREYHVLCGLSKTRLPIAVPVMTAKGDWCAQDQHGKVYCLYPKLPGHVVTEHYAGDAEERALEFGRAIGLLHTCFQERDDIPEYQGTGLMEQMEGWALRAIREGGTTVDVCAIEQIWRDTAVELQPLYNELPRQLIHRDAHTSNMLFSADQLTGVLDFEMVRRGPRVFDVCYCASSILVEGFEDPENASKWPRLLHSLVRGYEAFCPLMASEWQALYGVFVIIELLFIAFFLDHRQDTGAAKEAERLLYWLAANRDLLAAQRRSKL